MNKGDNAWQLMAATMVGLQTIPGLVILYGSMVNKSWAINSAFMAFYAFAAVILCWAAWAYRMSFGEEWVFFVGKPAVALDEKFLLGQAFLGAFPTATMVFFQGVFAAITVVLIGGSLLGRMNIRAWMLFVPLWLTFSYTVTAFSIWSPNGWLAKRGVIDFAGGFVIHLSAGVAATTAAFWVGPRAEKEKETLGSNNMIVALGGAGLVWMGWSGFNGGGPFAVNTVASLAILNTHVCAATSIITWLIFDTFHSGKPTVFGGIQGMITGLVCITPAAGIVQGWAAILMGFISGSVPWYTLMVVHHKIKLLNKIDDPMAIFHTHAITGTLGGILTGLFAVPKLCRLFYGVPDWEKYTGLLYGLQNGSTHAGLKQLWIQLEAIAFVVIFNVIITSLICLGVRGIVPLRVVDALEVGGDIGMHGEEAFALCCSEDRDNSKFENVKRNRIYDTQDFQSSVDESSRTMTVSESQMV
ncbi:Ammonium transporter 2 member 4 [Stylosanthes scabra]|uniref:Ammonium transporter 2 member 4 n=1 Tax=Stylosanthes scabra TaxID=79078 RepID=A0ABU6TJQ4_9FABA|nr:Ammonium transporter 2 member 4 [Stylosanthes scabra]